MSLQTSKVYFGNVSFTYKHNLGLFCDLVTEIFYTSKKQKRTRL